MAWPKGKWKVRMPDGLEFWLGAVPDNELSEILDVNTRTIRIRRQRLGLEPSGLQFGTVRLKQRRERWKNDDMVRELLPKLQCLERVAREMGLTRQRVQQIAKRAGCRLVWEAC